MTQIDDNFKNVDLATDDDVTAAVAPLLVDPVTGRLLIEIMSVLSFNDLDISSKIDENYEGVALAVDDDATAKIKPLKIDPTNGGLICDITV